MNGRSRVVVRRGTVILVIVTVGTFAFPDAPAVLIALGIIVLAWGALVLIRRAWQQVGR